jgi:predicted lipoprotein
LDYRILCPLLSDNEFSADSHTALTLIIEYLLTEDTLDLVPRKSTALFYHRRDGATTRQQEIYRRSETALEDQAA